MSYWNYRVLTDGAKYWISEVYYNRAGQPEGYTDPLKDLYEWDRLEDLITTSRLVSFAMEKPVLKVDPTTEKILGEV